MLYRSKIVVVEATQWFKNGDHPEDNVFRPFEDAGKVPAEPREGLIVRYFRHPKISGESICQYCGMTMHTHGWIDKIAENRVCPGDYIITSIHGVYVEIHKSEFCLLYEPL